MRVQGFVGVTVHRTLFADKLNKLWSEKARDEDDVPSRTGQHICFTIMRRTKILHLLTTNVGIGGEQDGEACQLVGSGGFMSHDGPLGQIGVSESL